MTRFLPRAPRAMQVALAGTQESFSAPASAQGFSAELPRCPRAGAPVRGTLVLEGEQFEFAGEVAWSQPLDPRACVRGRMTVRFTRVADRFFELLRG